MGSIKDDSFIDPDYVRFHPCERGSLFQEHFFLNLQLHISGLTSDLPFHISSEEAIIGLISSTTNHLQRIGKKPSLITISRQVNFIGAFSLIVM